MKTIHATAHARGHIPRFALALALAVSAAPAEAQTYKICDLGTGHLCLGYEIVGASGAPFVVNLWNESQVNGAGRILGVAFWNLGATVALDEVKYFDGSALGSAMPFDGDWTNGPTNGYGVTGWNAAVGLANSKGDGFMRDPLSGVTSCNETGGQGVYGQNCWLTGYGATRRYLQFSFTGGATDFDVANIRAGFRAQGTDFTGGSFKCGYGGADVEGMCGAITAITTTTVTTNTVPEPATCALMAAGLLAIGSAARRRPRE